MIKSLLLRLSLCVWHELHNIVLTSSLGCGRLISSFKVWQKRAFQRLENCISTEMKRWKIQWGLKIILIASFYMLDSKGLRGFRFASHVSILHELTHFVNSFITRKHGSHMAKGKQHRLCYNLLAFLWCYLGDFCLFHNYKNSYKELGESFFQELLNSCFPNSASCI